MQYIDVRTVLMLRLGVMPISAFYIMVSIKENTFITSEQSICFWFRYPDAIKKKIAHASGQRLNNQLYNLSTRNRDSRIKIKVNSHR